MRAVTSHQYYVQLGNVDPENMLSDLCKAGKCWQMVEYCEGKFLILRVHSKIKKIMLYVHTIAQLVHGDRIQRNV